MEPEGAVPEASWGSFDASVSVEDSEVMAQLLGTPYFSCENEQKTSLFWPGHDSNSNLCSPNVNNYNSYFWPPSNSYELGYCFGDGNAMPPIDCGIDQEPLIDPSLQIGLSNPVEKRLSLNEETSGNEKEKFNLGEDEKDEASTINKRKARASIPAPKRAKNSQSKKAQKNINTKNEEEGMSYSSDDDSNASNEINGGENASSSSKKSVNTSQNGKPRAGRGSATDPQSLYARKRRERINERLKILQNLVPNGTKVDISTMLEEAVHYVKFLQLQIKLLSSDDLWMYAPIAYNGVNIGLDLKISPPQQ